jgi:hypothetical protein
MQVVNVMHTLEFLSSWQSPIGWSLSVQADSEAGATRRLGLLVRTNGAERVQYILVPLYLRKKDHHNQKRTGVPHY